MHHSLRKIFFVLVLITPTLSVGADQYEVKCEYLTAVGRPSFTCPPRHIEKQSGICKWECESTDTYSSWVVDGTGVGAVTGRRSYLAVTNGTRRITKSERMSAPFTCGALKDARDKCERALGREFTWEVKRQFCPDETKSKFAGGQATSAEQACASKLPENQCQKIPCSFSACSADDIPVCGNPDCCSIQECNDYYSTPDYPCEALARSAHSDCIQSYQQSSPGTNDCYCNDNDQYFKFETASGQWKCNPCPTGTVQDRAGGGTSCKSMCADRGPNFWYNPALPGCVACSAPDVVLTTSQGSVCGPDCRSNEVLDPSSTTGCKVACADGMKALRDSKGGLDRCACNIDEFGGDAAPRSAVQWENLGGARSGWRAVQGLAAASPFIRCACATGANPPNVSALDSADSIALNNLSADRVYYGPVALTSDVGSSRYSCGCPNFNEVFQLDSRFGFYRCVPKLKGDGAVLFDYDSSLQSDERNGVHTTDSDLPDMKTALLRSGAGSGGTDLKTPYLRRVWRCRKGTTWNKSTGSCDPVRLNWTAQNCSDEGVRSSKETISEFNTPGASISWGKVVNPALACCTSDRNDDPFSGAKYHCASSQPAAGQNFDSYYDAPGGTDDTAGVTFPNRLFLTDGQRVPQPVIGFFRADGVRTTFADGLSRVAFLQGLSEVAARIRAGNRTDPLNVPAFAGLTIDPKVKFMVRTAVAFTCDSDPSTRTTTGIQRCARATEVRIHYHVVDFSDPGAERRTVMHTVSSISESGENPAPTSVIDIRRLLSGKSVSP